METTTKKDDAFGATADASAVAPPAASAAGTNKPAAASGTLKKKRSNSKQPADSKTAKKKKRDPADATTTTTTTTTTAATKKKSAPSGSSTTVGGTTNISNRPLVDQVLYRLTEGVPRMELKAVVREADECEKALLQEIQLLEDALKEEQESHSKLSKPGAAVAAGATPADDATANIPASTAADTTNPPTTGGEAEQETPEATIDAAATAARTKKQQAVNGILENPLTPLDRCFTLSALLGRLRDDLALPSIRNPALAAVTAAGAANKKKKANSTPAPTYPQLVALADHPNYTRVHVSASPSSLPTTDPAQQQQQQQPTQLLHVWRKIASHRTAMVFKRPVKPEEAPGYTDRILFPMDLSLVRKMIVSRILTSYSEVHQRIRLISHNCVKYNGRYVLYRMCGGDGVDDQYGKCVAIVYILRISILMHRLTFFSSTDATIMICCSGRAITGLWHVNLKLS